MKKAIKICSLLLTLVMALALFGCGGSDKKDSGDEECSSHKYQAGICKNCSHDIFEDLDKLKLSSVSEEEFAEFVDKVANNSTQGEISLEKYGAEIVIDKLMRDYSGENYNVVTKFWYYATVKVQFVDEIYKSEIDVKVSPYSDSDPNANDFNFIHQAYIVDKTIYSSQPNALNSLGEVTDCTNDQYNTILDIIRKASTYESKNLGSATSWEIASANLPMAYTQLYTMLNCDYFYAKVGNYFLVKVTFADQYMGDLKVFYIYDEQYDLVGFDAFNKINEDDYIDIALKPLKGKVEIPSDIK